jgi:Cytochrome c7 and related cytochrome c/Class III cytochrome C family
VIARVSLVLLLAFCANAQKAPAKQEVPDNISEHAAPRQPLPFSHKAHIAQGLQCRQCHTNPDPGAQMTLPGVTACTICHSSITEPIPWARVYQLTPGVTWTHRKHLQAGMQCVMCHGDVAKLDAMAQNTAVLAMASCITCHQAHQATTACATCHAWPSP